MYLAKASPLSLCEPMTLVARCTSLACHAGGTHIATSHGDKEHQSSTVCRRLSTEMTIELLSRRCREHLVFALTRTWSAWPSSVLSDGARASMPLDHQMGYLFVHVLHEQKVAAGYHKHCSTQRDSGTCPIKRFLFDPCLTVA